MSNPLENLLFLYANNKREDQSVQMHRLIFVFVIRDN